MNAILPAVVSAIAALAGVLLTQMLNTRASNSTGNLERQHILWNERRATLLRFVVTLNQAIDSTREAILIADSPERAKQIDDERASQWAAAYERTLEMALVFPDTPAKMALDHLHATYRWRYQSVAEGRDTTAPAHEDLIEQMRPWLAFGSA